MGRCRVPWGWSMLGARLGGGRRRLQRGRAGAARTAQPPDGEADDGDRREDRETARERDLTEPVHALPAKCGRRFRLRRRELELVLAGVDVGVEAEELGVLTEEAAAVWPGGQEIELFEFEGFQVAHANVRRGLDLGQLESPLAACLAKAAADLEHRLDPSSIPRGSVWAEVTPSERRLTESRERGACAHSPRIGPWCRRGGEGTSHGVTPCLERTCLMSHLNWCGHAIIAEW